MKKKQTKIEADIKQAHEDYKKGDYRVFNPKTGELDQPQEAWEIRFDKEFQGYLVLTDGKETLSKPREEIKQFIRTLLEAQQGELYAWFNKALLKQKKEWIDVSSWKNLGEKYGYFKFFENKIKKEIIEEILTKLKSENRNLTAQTKYGYDSAVLIVMKLLKD